MKTLLNTLYVQTSGAYLRLDHETLKVEIDKEVRLQVPLHHLGSLVLFGEVMVSPALLGRCAQDGRSVTWLSRSGRFLGRLEGPVSGNVLLRRAQHQAMDSPLLSLEVARNLVAGKLKNQRHVILRSARETDDSRDHELLSHTAQILAEILLQLPAVADPDTLRGLEGAAARHYFAGFSSMIRADRETFAITGRTRRPPLDPTNALLSFLYALLLSDCVAGAQGVGLDPQMGLLHGLRPGRPSLGLDLMEEFRPILADRLTLTLINRRQLSPQDFDRRTGGAVLLNDAGRKKVVVAYQERKQEEIFHPGVQQKMPLGLAPHIQARLLARHLRGELAAYPPYLHK
ncbi:MAG: type I-C CRISPR-associated endonuclease Cas1c [Proteobacteria bacterium]|nr:type I-C CRISPR-associated endonuclease Cas1c [Pseudomonadota bacterium]MBU4354408.1 type I-C CRISPR-associated endonuclease Cas1c [Pseudomonadota bacterium]MBU4448952.1 type I-C CRISPR-associated endonuclease Cas1c [Pseudomonadota bacterium]